jgi:hypothetical protein
MTLDQESACDHVLTEALVGAFGLPPGRDFVSIKGDPSLRETVPLRPRQASRMDAIAGDVLAACAELLRETGVYALYVGFNSSEVRTESIFNPFAYEVHDACELVRDGYLGRHFVRVPYAEKLATIQRARAAIQTGALAEYLPPHWRRLMEAARRDADGVPQALIDELVAGLDRLRGIDGYYLRNAAISLSEGIVRASYNCDGTYFVRAAHFPAFVAQNTP